MLGMVEDVRGYTRHMHNNLLISITLQLGLIIQPLLPCFFQYLPPRPGCSFVEGTDAWEVYLGVDVVLEGGC